MPLLTPADIRSLAAAAGVHPTKSLGQNFVHDAGVVRRIVRAADVSPGDHVLEVGPGLGSLTLGLLEAGAHVTAIEIDDVMAPLLSQTVAARMPDAADRLAVHHADALTVTGADELPGPPSLGSDPAPPTKLVANLPYNVATPVLLTFLEVMPSLSEILVMVQAEVADRLAEPPGSRVYGVPSAKAAWYAEARRAGTISRTVFWPVPNVDSALVRIVRRDPPGTSAPREDVFAVIDAAFSQRRKTLRAALAVWAGSAAEAERRLRAAGIDPSRRGETLHIAEFARIAESGSGDAEGTEDHDAGGPARD